MTASTSSSDLLYTRPAVTVRRRVRPRPLVDVARLMRYRGGTYSHTVDRVVFTDGTWARTDLIRLNPGVEAYSLDFTGVAPTRPSRYQVDTWAAVPNLRLQGHLALEVQVDWILRNSVPRLGVAELSRRLRAAGVPLGVGNISEHEAIAATQAAIWHLTNGLDLDTRPLNEPTAVRRGTDGVTVEFDGTPELGGYTVELVAQGEVTVTLHKSADGRTWREVPSSQLTVRGTGEHRKRLGVGATVSARRHGRAAQGHRFYRLTVSGNATIGDVGFWLDGSGTYRNAERIVALYGYLLAGARRARQRTTAPRLSAAGATIDAGGLIGPLRLGATDSALLSSENAVVVDSTGAELAGALEPGSVIYLRPRNGQTAVTVTMTVPGTEDGYGGRVLTGVARDEVSSTFTPLALAVPAELVVDFDIEWTR
jgi:TQXA domain-containing protein